MTAVEAPPTIETLADLLERLGPTPPSRVRYRPRPGDATEQDVAECKVRFGRLCELVDGVLVEKAAGVYESRLAAALIFCLESFRANRDLGIVLGADGMVRIAGQVRLPDVSFFSWDHFPGRLLPRGGILGVVPDFAVEVLSPSNTEREMARKRRECFGGGTRLFWQVYPETRRVRVSTAATRFGERGEGDTPRGGGGLPGLLLPGRASFERGGRRPP